MTDAKRILVIDDEQDFCRMMVEMLTGEGYNVDSAAHPILAAEQALSGDYDLITLDLNLEEFNGIDGTAVRAILEPACVASLVQTLGWSMNARSADLPASFGP